MSANSEISSVVTGLEKFSFHCNTKERQCQRMFKTPHNCTCLTHQQSNAQNSLIQALTVRELWTLYSRCLSWIEKSRGTRNQIVNILCIIENARDFQKKKKHLLYWLHQSLWLCLSQQTMENSERDGNTRSPDLPPEKSVCRSTSKS